MAIVDSLSSPVDWAAFDSDADCNVFWTFTAETSGYVNIYVRNNGAGDSIVVTCYTGAVVVLKTLEDWGTWNNLDSGDTTLTADVEYTVRVTCNGTALTVYVDDEEEASGISSIMQTQEGGYVNHNLSTNDIELESWPYGEPVEAVQVDWTKGAVAVSGNNFDISSGASSPIDMTLGAVSIGANNFTISADIVINMSPPGSTVGWDVGAYIYESSGTTLITGYSFDISASESSQMSLGEVVVSGNGFDINSETVVNMLLAALAVASNAFALNSETFVNATLGTVSVAGNTFRIISDGNANMTLGEIVVSGNDFTIESESFIDMSAGTISALGKKFTITRTDVGPGGVIGGGVSSVRIKMTLILR